MTNFLQRIGSKSITYENAFPPKNRSLLLQRQVNYVEDIISTRDMSNLGISRRGVIHKTLDIGKARYYVQADNNLGYLIRVKLLQNLNRHGRVVKAQ